MPHSSPIAGEQPNPSHHRCHQRSSREIESLHNRRKSSLKNFSGPTMRFPSSQLYTSRFSIHTCPSWQSRRGDPSLHTPRDDAWNSTQNETDDSAERAERGTFSRSCPLPFPLPAPPFVRRPSAQIDRPPQRSAPAGSLPWAPTPRAAPAVVACALCGAAWVAGWRGEAQT